MFSALLKCAKVELHVSSRRWKCWYIPHNSRGTDREDILPGNLCIRHQQKTICLPRQSMISGCSEKNHGRINLTLSFSDNIIFLEKLLLKLYPVSLPTIKRMFYFKTNLSVFKTIEYLLMPLVSNKEGDFCLLHLFVVVSSIF